MIPFLFFYLSPIISFSFTQTSYFFFYISHILFILFSYILFLSASLTHFISFSLSLSLSLSHTHPHTHTHTHPHPHIISFLFNTVHFCLKHTVLFARKIHYFSTTLSHTHTHPNGRISMSHRISIPNARPNFLLPFCPHSVSCCCRYQLLGATILPRWGEQKNGFGGFNCFLSELGIKVTKNRFLTSVASFAFVCQHV